MTRRRARSRVRLSTCSRSSADSHDRSPTPLSSRSQSIESASADASDWKNAPRPCASAQSPRPSSEEDVPHAPRKSWAIGVTASAQRCVVLSCSFWAALAILPARVGLHDGDHLRFQVGRRRDGARAREPRGALQHVLLRRQRFLPDGVEEVARVAQHVALAARAVAIGALEDDRRVEIGAEEARDDGERGGALRRVGGCRSGVAEPRELARLREAALRLAILELGRVLGDLAPDVVREARLRSLRLRRDAEPEGQAAPRILHAVDVRAVLALRHAHAVLVHVVDAALLVAGLRCGPRGKRRSERPRKAQHDPRPGASGSPHLGTFLLGANACVPRIRARFDASRGICADDRAERRPGETDEAVGGSVPADDARGEEPGLATNLIFEPLMPCLGAALCGDIDAVRAWLGCGPWVRGDPIDSNSPCVIRLSNLPARGAGCPKKPEVPA